MRILYCLLLLSFMVLSFGVDAQEDLQIKNNSGEVLMEVREDGMLIRRLSTSERMSYNPTSNDNGLRVYDTDTKGFWVWKDTQWMPIGGSDADSDPTNELELPPNPATGTMAYFDGNDWVQL